jgi:hypothetical protein
VLSMPPAFALSQDQTLRFIMLALAGETDQGNKDEQTLPRIQARDLRQLHQSSGSNRKSSSQA